MMMLKAFDKIVEDWGEDIYDFYVSYDLCIGPIEIDGAYEVFHLDIISPKRLESVLVNGELMIPRGYMIMNDFNVNKIRDEVNKIIKKCEVENWDDTYCNISRFLRWEEDSTIY